MPAIATTPVSHLAMITNGASVLMITNLDSGTGKAVIQQAKARGVTVIDYDRPTFGGGAPYYLSFDNVKVGKLMGDGLATCLTDKQVVNPVVAYLNGGPTDNNATLFDRPGLTWPPGSAPRSTTNNRAVAWVVTCVFTRV